MTTLSVFDSSGTLTYNSEYISVDLIYSGTVNISYLNIPAEHIGSGVLNTAILAPTPEDFSSYYLAVDIPVGAFVAAAPIYNASDIPRTCYVYADKFSSITLPPKNVGVVIRASGTSAVNIRVYRKTAPSSSTYGIVRYYEGNMVPISSPASKILSYSKALLGSSWVRLNSVNDYKVKYRLHTFTGVGGGYLFGDRLGVGYTPATSGFSDEVVFGLYRLDTTNVSVEAREPGFGNPNTDYTDVGAIHGEEYYTNRAIFLMGMI